MIDTDRPAADAGGGAPTRKGSTPSEPIDLRRRWLAITAATIVMQFAYWPIVASVAMRVGDTPGVSPGLLAFGLALVPFTFLVAAFGSRHPNAATATLQALGLFLLIGLPLIVVVDALAGTVAGLAAGGVTALRRDEIHRLRWRWIAVAVAVAYLTALRFVALDFALVSGAVLPFVVHGLVDQAAETR